MCDPAISSGKMEDAAASWLSRRDRGLTAPEQDAYLEWLYRDPAHGRAIVRLERAWTLLNQLDQWRPAHSAAPNPDLLAPRFPTRRHWPVVAGFVAAAAAVVAVGLILWLPGRPTMPAPRVAIIQPGAERQVLADGSVVELNTGAKIDVQYAPAERRVRLLAGEAHFSVAKNPARPFVVSAGPVSVHAVGTAFGVTLGTREVSVLVTEGRVRVEDTAISGPSAPAGAGEAYLSSGQQAIIALVASPTSPIQVNDVTPAQMESALAWKGMRLKFVEMPLRDVVAEFNRYNRTQLVVADDVTGAVLVEGNFLADNVDAFVRLLEPGFRVHAVRDGNRIVLRQVP